MLQGWAARTGSAMQAWPDLDPDDKRGDALALFRKKRPGGASRPSSDPEAMPGTWQE
jgi:hypothetical protein